MKVITAPEDYTRQKNDVFCFLAGGITGCPNWQNKVLQKLTEYDPENLVIFNPRRKNFDVTNEDATYEQINWEFYYLNHMNIFSMYFCANEIQPICLYELGRYVEVMKNNYPGDFENRIIITIEHGYPRSSDVLQQTYLAFNGRTPNIHLLCPSIEQHSNNIIKAYEKIGKCKGGEKEE